MRMIIALRANAAANLKNDTNTTRDPIDKSSLGFHAAQVTKSLLEFCYFYQACRSGIGPFGFKQSKQMREAKSRLEAAQSKKRRQILLHPSEAGRRMTGTCKHPPI